MDWLLWTILACSGASEPNEAGVAAADEPAEVAPQQVEEPAAVPLPDPAEPRYAASHILVAYAGAVNAPKGVTRTREEARAAAGQLLQRAAAGEPFDALARASSDGTSAPRGGRVGVYRTGTMVPAFERAVASVEPGAVGPLVETPFGWHVVRREPIVEVAASHLIVGWAGAHRSAATRSKDEARARADQALAEIRGGAAFEEVVSRYSEDATAADGGSLGTITPGQMVPAFEDAVFALEVDEVSDVVETPYGFHVVRRVR